MLTWPCDGGLLLDLFRSAYGWNPLLAIRVPFYIFSFKLLLSLLIDGLDSGAPAPPLPI